MKEKILRELREFPGKIGFYYKNLTTGEEWSLNPELQLKAASVIKIPVLVEAFTQMESGKADRNELYKVREEDKVPSCGALTYLHTELEVTLNDLCTLMIILSDNTASNILIRKFGIEEINGCMRRLDLTVTTVNRLLFDSEAAAQGKENYICAGEIGGLLEKMYCGTLVSKAASEKMLKILANQRLNSKMPFFFKEGVKIAHKTGEDDGITHDVGIVYAPQPFAVCFCSNEVEVPRFEMVIQRVTRALYDMQQRG